jgi:hypothetical protein
MLPAREVELRGSVRRGEGLTAQHVELREVTDGVVGRGDLPVQRLLPAGPGGLLVLDNPV